MASIKKRNNTFLITVTGGNEAGKPRRFYTTFKPSAELTEKQALKAAQIFAYDYEKKVKDNIMFDSSKMTLAAFADIYIEHKKEELKITTLEEVGRELKQHILPQLGNLRLNNIKVAQVQNFKKYLSGAKSKHGKSLSAGTQKRIYDTLSGVLHYAEQLDIIEINPCRKAGSIKQGSKTQNNNYLSAEEATAILEYIQGLPVQQRTLFTLAIYTGLRLGELVGLSFSDIDLKNGIIKVHSSAAVVKGQQINLTPKTAASVRDIPLAAPCRSAIMELQVFHHFEEKRLASEYIKSDYLFRQWNGGQIHHDTPRHWWNEILAEYNKEASEEAKIGHITFHGLRHTAATLMLSQTQDIKSVQAILGHSKASTTMDIYAHALEGKKKTAVDSLAALLAK